MILVLRTLLLAACAVVLSACFSPSPSGNAPPPFSGKEVTLTRPMFLYRADRHQYQLEPLVATTYRIRTAPGVQSEFLHLIEEWPAGTKLRLLETRTQRQGGERWLLFIGETPGDKNGARRFEHLVLVPQTGTPELPFTVGRAE